MTTPRLLFRACPTIPAPLFQHEPPAPSLSWFAVLFQKLSVADCPLYLRLLAGPDNDVLSFVLKENETGEVEVGLGPGACGTNQSSGRPGQVQVAVVLTPSVGGGRAAAMEAAGNMAWESQASPGKGWALEV